MSLDKQSHSADEALEDDYECEDGSDVDSSRRNSDTSSGVSAQATKAVLDAALGALVGAGVLPSVDILTGVNKLPGRHDEPNVCTGFKGPKEEHGRAEQIQNQDHANRANDLNQKSDRSVDLSKDINKLPSRHDEPNVCTGFKGPKEEHGRTEQIQKPDLEKLGILNEKPDRSAILEAIKDLSAEAKNEGKLSSEDITRVLEQHKIKLSPEHTEKLTNLANALASGKGIEEAMQNIPLDDKNHMDPNFLKALSAVMEKAGYKVEDECCGGTHMTVRAMLITRNDKDGKPVDGMRINTWKEHEPGKPVKNNSSVSLCEPYVKGNGETSWSPVTKPAELAKFKADLSKKLKN
ncbi:MAG: hypothetical protein K2X27_10615 [Candidatus Obscuribacterales bacterium]|nr:hypothetical protein [Candidatus Obscuribacterales bacterium]